MLNKIKNLKNIFVDVEGANIPVDENSNPGTPRKNSGPGLNITSPKPKIIRSLRTVADMERGKFRRMFDRHRVVYGY